MANRSLSAGDEGSHHVGGVTIEVLSTPVVASGGPGIGVPGRDLHVSKWYPRVQAGGDEAVAKRVRRDVLGDLGSRGETTNDPGGAVSVEAAARAAEKHGTGQTIPGGQVDGPGHPGRHGQRGEFCALA